MRRKLFGALLVLGVASGCGGAPPDGNPVALLNLSPNPGSIAADGEVLVIHIVGTTQTGAPGQCDVGVAASPGTLDGSFSPIQVVLDAFGTGVVNYACDQRVDPGCQNIATVTAVCASRIVASMAVFLTPIGGFDAGLADAGSPSDGGVLADAGTGFDGGVNPDSGTRPDGG
jgi:hypothetical protein